MAGPTAVPGAVQPAFPDRPNRLEDFPGAIARFLTTTPGNEDRLTSLFASWHLPPKPDFTIVRADTDGDGVHELLLALAAVGEMDGRADLRPRQSHLLILLDPEDSGWHGYLLHPSNDQDVAGAYALPEVLEVIDIGKDGRGEVIFTTGDCGAHTCFVSVHVASWDGREYISLTSSPPAMASAEVSLVDTDGDGVVEVVMTGGIIGSVGAGLQRTPCASS